MTGFARLDGGTTLSPDPAANADAADRALQWTIELRSVNGKGLDIRLRTPASLDGLDQELKKLISKKLGRGNVTLNLNLKNNSSGKRLELDEDAFRDVLGAAEKAAKISGLPMPDLGTLLTNRSVLKETENQQTETQTATLHQAITSDIEAAIDQLIRAQQEEGRALQSTIEERLTTIASLTKDATETSEAQAEGLKQRLGDALSKLLTEAETMDEARLHQEAMLIAVKADITEELDRLRAHIDQANDLLTRDEPVGRRFDFLCQEFNREANTLCSKASSKELTYIGLELKTIIDQLREQVQNIE